MSTGSVPDTGSATYAYIALCVQWYNGLTVQRTMHSSVTK